MLPRAWSALFPAADRRVTLEGRTVRELVDGLEACLPGMRDRLCDPGPALREFINVYVDGEPADLASPVSERTVVHVLPAVAGG